MAETSTNVLEWDGNGEGLVSAMEDPGGGIYKISDVVLEPSDLINAVFTIHRIENGIEDEIETIITDKNMGVISENLFIIDEVVICIVKEDNTEFAEFRVIFPEAGIYFLSVESEGTKIFATKLEINNGSFPFTTTSEVVHKLDVKYLPNTVANKEYVDTEITAAKEELTESIAEAYQPKGEYLTEHQQIKTINGESLVGEGDVVIEGVKSWNDLEDKPFGENIDYVVVAHEHVSGNRKNLQTNIPGYSNPDSIYFNGDKLIVGDTYIITVDGVDYETIVLCSDDVNSGLPYFEVEAVTANVIKMANGSKVVRLTFPINITYRIKLTHVQKSITTIDPKYLPDDIATKEYVDTEINKPKDYIRLNDVVNGYTYIIQMRNGNLVSRCTISSIEVTTMPNVTEYYAGELFNPAGMVVTGVCEDSSVIEITNYTLPDNRLIIGENVITISYNEFGIDYTTTITVNAIEFDAATILIDFDYTTNDDGTYTITGWKQTLNGVPSNEMIVPDYSLIRL